LSRVLVPIKIRAPTKKNKFAPRLKKINSRPEKEISIFDVLGKQVLNTKTASDSINIASLRSGLYFVKISENGKGFIQKIIKN
jgi:hypothetical protein